MALLRLDKFSDVYTLPSQIRELRSPIVDPVNCEPGQPFGITARAVCVGNVNGTDGSCFGDSGGPIVIKITGVFYDAGITSRTVPDFCGVAPDSYTSTPEFRTEIYDVARGVPAATAPTIRKADDLGLPYEKPSIVSRELCRC